MGGIDISGHKGLYDKYQVTHKDTGEVCDGAFVLRPVTDTAARIALATYAEATHNPRLGKEIREWLKKLRKSS